MSMESVSKNFIFFLIKFFLCLNYILCQINDNYEKHYLENGTYDLLDVNDYHNLKIIVSTSKNIYIGIPPSYKTKTEAELINSTSLITLNENYLLAACLNNSILTRISLIDGTFTNILDYSDIDNSLSLKIPSTTCSLSKLENLIFIGYSEAQYYEVINGNDTEIFGNKTNIVIKLNIENIDSEPNIIEKEYFTFPISTTLTGSIREISCVPIKIINDENNYRLVCVYETLEYAADYNAYRYYVYSTIINENFDNFENKMDDVRIYRTNDYSGFRIYKIDDYNAICLSKKTVRDIHLEYVEGILTIISIESSKNLSTISSSPDLFDYNNNFVFYAEDKNPYYFRLNKKSSANYFMLYDYYEKNGLSTIKKLIGYYDEINDYILVVFQNNQTNYIKYFTLQNNANIYNIGAYTGIHRIKTNETAEYELYNLLDFSQFGNIQINKITTYKNNEQSSQTYAKDNIYLLNQDNKVIVTADLSLNYWFDYTFLLIEEVNNNYKKYFYLNDVTLSIRTCAYQCGSCYEDYYKCDECRNDNFILLNLTENENICYPINQLLKGHVYNSANNTFQECYSSCDFCTEHSENSEDHKCEECSKNYYPSYNNLGNCYQLTDSNFLTESCPKYRINSTGECINECPTSTPYYLFQYNYVNLTEQTNENLEQIYTKTSVKPPKYLFNNICYDSCPLYSLPDDDNNICVCEFGYHIDSDTSETICHPGLYCVSSNTNYRYFLEDTKECITEGCPTDYYQFNFRCYKDGCPENTIASDTDPHKCISSFSYCYINELFENICSGEQSEEYIYNFDETLQYLKNCEESEIYTTQSSKTYLFNDICYITCPGNTRINTEQNECICINFGYYPTDGIIICYGENEKCGDGKIPVIDNKKCLNSIEECYALNYKSFNNECFSLNCPSNSEIDSSTGKTCICLYLFYNDINQNILNCFDESITECPSENYEFYNPDTKECFISMEDCFNKGNNYFFNKYCYKIGCPSDKILLYDQNIQIQNYYKTNLLLSNDELIDKLCICDINNGVWSNYTSDNQIYYQECLTQCPTGYLAESTTNQCLRISPTTIITTLPETQTTIITSQPITTELITTIITTHPISTIITTQPKTTLPKIFTTETITTVIKEKNHIEIVIPDEYYKDKENCKVVYKNQCYLQCPAGTCLTQDDPLLITCVEITSKTKIFNDICFENFDDIIKNIKSMSENDDIISTESGIIIRGYSTNSDSDIDSEAKYSLVDLGDCEEKIREYYNLDEDTELFILGIDSPNKDSTASTSVYNYGVYLENGTLLDHSEACKDTKISVSSVITNTDLVKLDDAIYFNDMGYDIYNESSSFYTDNCAPASVDGNDITR